MNWSHWLRWLAGEDKSCSSGETGERLAAQWLVRQRGFTVIARNWRNPADRREEIDLVGRDREVLVFVEVKTREAGARVPGYYAIDERKRRVLRRGIRAYLKQLHAKPRTFRFDVVEVIIQGDASARWEILHFENVPLFSKCFRV